MKQLIVPIAIIVALIAFFVIVDRKEFSRHDDVQTVQSESSTTNRKPTVFVPETKPVTDVKTAAETKPVETKPVAETNPATEAKPVTEAKPKTDPKPAETKPVADTKTVGTNPEEKLLPAAVPVVTAAEAEKLNAEAIEYTKPWINLSSYVEKGYNNIYSANFNKLVGFNLTTSIEKSLQEKGFDVPDFKRRLLPDSWTIDFSTIPAGASFQKVNDGYNLSSIIDSLRILAPRFDSMKGSFFFNAIIKNMSDSAECNVELGVHSSGLMNKGYNRIKTETIAPGKETVVQWEVSVFDHYSDISPAISINGDVIIKSFSVYRLDHKDFTVVEGTIQERSILPEPQDTDYPDCRFTAHFIGNSIASGKPCKKELVLSVEGFLDKKILPTNTLKTNDKIKCAIVRFDSVPESVSGIQEADNLNLFDLDSYLVTSYEKISSFSDYTETNLGVVFDDLSNSKETYISIFDKQINPSMSPELKQAQVKAIEKDLKRINDMLLPYTNERKQEINSKFLETWEAEKKKDKPDYNRIERWVWRNVDNSFYALPESYNIIQDYPTISQENLDSLIAFKDYLESQGIQLIISIVPVSYDISARVINRAFSSLPDFRTANLVKQLLENNIEAIYASDIMISKYNQYENPFYFPGDSHPGDLPQDVLSDILAEKLVRFEFEKQFDKEQFKIVRSPNTYKFATLRDRTFPEKCDIGNHMPGDFYTINIIYYQNQTIKNDTNSPIILLGNSFSTVPEPISNYLTMKTGVGIYHYSVAGIGVLSTTFQRIFNSPEKFLKDRKVFILALGTIHLLSDIPVPNLRELDMGANVIHNKKLVKKIDVAGNTFSIPEYASQLSNPSLFATASDGSCTILEDIALESSTKSTSDFYLALTYCSETNDHFELEINGTSYPLTGADHSYMWLKKVIPIPQGTEKLCIKAKGKKNAYIAIGDINLYQ